MTAVQVAILFPALLFWLMLIVQYGLWWHAKQVANAAAAEAVAAAQVPEGTEADGQHDLPLAVIASRCALVKGLRRGVTAASSNGTLGTGQPTSRPRVWDGVAFVGMRPEPSFWSMLRIGRGVSSPRAVPGA